METMGPPRPLSPNFSPLSGDADKAMKAIWNEVTLAESDETIVVEGNHYFPSDSIKRQHFQESDKHTTCSWKGVASYHHIVIDGKRNDDAAWYYPEPKDAAKEIKNYLAFWNGVAIVP